MTQGNSSGRSDVALRGAVAISGPRGQEVTEAQVQGPEPPIPCRLPWATGGASLRRGLTAVRGTPGARVLG